MGRRRRGVGKGESVSRAGDPHRFPASFLVHAAREGRGRKRGSATDAELHGECAEPVVLCVVCEGSTGRYESSGKPLKSGTSWSKQG